MVIPIDINNRKIAYSNNKSVIYLNIDDNTGKNIIKDLLPDSKFLCVVSKLIYNPNKLNDDYDDLDVIDCINYKVYDVHSNMFEAIIAYKKDLSSNGSTLQVYYDELYSTYSINIRMHYKIMFSIRRVKDIEKNKTSKFIDIT